MPIEKPRGELWDALGYSAENAWPDEEEDDHVALGAAWTNLGSTLRWAGEQKDPLPAGAWEDDAGHFFREHLAQERALHIEAGDACARVGDITNSFCETLVYTKVNILKMVQENEPLYDSLRTWYFWPDEGARAEFARELGLQIHYFGKDMVERVASRK